MRSFASVILHLLTPILRLSFYLMNRRPFFIRRKHVSSGSLLPKKDRSAHNYSLLLTVRTFCGLAQRCLGQASRSAYPTRRVN